MIIAVAKCDAVESGTELLETMCGPAGHARARLRISGSRPFVGDWVVTNEPTTTEEGIETSACTICGAQQTRPIPKKSATPSNPNKGVAAKTYDTLPLTAVAAALALSGAMLVVSRRKFAAAHPANQDKSARVLPDNLFIADASLFPRSMGNPPMLTIMALAMKVARLSCERLG